MLCFFRISIKLRVYFFQDAVIFLCDHVKNLNHVNSAGETVLHVSSTKGLDRLVTELLRRGAMPNMQNHEKK